MWEGLIQLLEDIMRTKRLSKRDLHLPDWLSWDIGLLSQTEIYTIGFPGSQAFELRL